MITSFKIFENIDVHIGDYVNMRCESGTGIPSFLKDEVGQIIDILNDNILVSVYFEKIDYKLTYVHKNHILYISKDKKDVESYIIGKKYNL